MSERKVLNKYYPPDFDPSKLPRVKREKNRQFTIRLMAPFNMRCKTCGEYIYRGKKFNARKEDVIGKTYLGIQIYRFYIKCTKCLAEITFLTDPENEDYEMENGAIRNFECIRLAEKQAELEAKQEKEEEANNPMKILENRTRDSRREMAVLETLEDLRELNAANSTVDPKILLEEEAEMKRRLEKQQEEEDEEEIQRIFGKKSVLVNKNEEIETVLIRENKHKLDDDNLVRKRIKTEPVSEESQTSSSVLFKKPANNLNNNISNNNKLNQSNKDKISTFIKKKPELTPSSSISSNPLASLTSYSSSSEEDS